MKAYFKTGKLFQKVPGDSEYSLRLPGLYIYESIIDPDPLNWKVRQRNVIAFKSKGSQWGNESSSREGTNDGDQKPREKTALFRPQSPWAYINLKNIYWVGQKLHLGFSVTYYGETQTNFLASPIFSKFHMAQDQK